MHSRVLRALLLGALATSSGACSAITDSRVGIGLGSACHSSADCQGGLCEGGICISTCQANRDCPPPAVCAHQSCRIPLSVGAALIGSVTDQEGWTSGHWRGLSEAAKDLGYVTLQARSNVPPNNPGPQLDGLVAAGAQVIIGNTVDYGAGFRAAAQRYPKVKFLWANDEVMNFGSRNATTFWIRNHQAWYVAGKMAASRAQRRLGVIAPFINPETVRNVNAFTLGARSIKPALVVEVRYIGFWQDVHKVPTYPYTDSDGYADVYFREEQAALQLMDTGCEVIAHGSNTQRSVRTIEERNNRGPTHAASLANDAEDGWKVAATNEGYRSCLGSIYENWQPLYREIFDQIERGTFNPFNPILRDITAEPSGNLTGVSVNHNNTAADESSVRAWTHELTVPPIAPNQRVFQGPYFTTGQRDSNNDGQVDQVQAVGDGQSVSDEELTRMCWYVKGVVEKTDPANPKSTDRDALVPGGLVDRAPPPAGAEAPPGLSLECLKNINS